MPLSSVCWITRLVEMMVLWSSLCHNAGLRYSSANHRYTGPKCPKSSGMMVCSVSGSFGAWMPLTKLSFHAK